MMWLKSSAVIDVQGAGRQTADPIRGKTAAKGHIFQRSRIIDSIHRDGVVARNLSGGKACPGGLLQVHGPAGGISVGFNDKGMRSGSENKAENESFEVCGVNPH